MINRCHLLGLAYPIVFGLNISPSFADISHHDLKGVDDIVSTDYKHLSPVNGFTLLGTKVLENMRFYGNYGPEIKDERSPKGKLLKKGFGCLDGDVGRILRENKDCPQDAVSELIQRFFPSQDGQNFVANQIPSDIVSHLTPEMIGRIIGRLSLLKEGDLKTKANEDKLAEDLKNILFQALNPERFEVSKKKKHLQGGCEAAVSSAVGIEGQIAQCEEVIGNPSDRSSSPSSSGSSRSSPPDQAKRTGVGREKDYKELAALIVAALKETPSQIYPAHLVEQTLLAFFWKKGNGKEDLIKLSSGMHKENAGAIARTDILADPRAKQLFLLQKYRPYDFDLIYLTNHPEQAAEEMLKYPEKMAFYASQDKVTNQEFPPIIFYGSAAHESLKDANPSTYSDCGETSLRNLLNIALFKDGKFDPSILDTLVTHNPNMHILKGLKEYYHKHPDPAKATSNEARNDWSQKVASGHKGVNYIKGGDQCEINAGIDNMIAVLDSLLFHGKEEESPLAKGRKRKEKLDALCKALSREGFELDWSHPKKVTQEDLPDTGTDITLSVNGKDSFTWHFGGGHFSLSEIHKGKNNWKDRLGVEIAKRIPSFPAQGSRALNWLLNERNWDRVMMELPHQMKKGSEVSSKLYLLPLSGTDGKILAYEKALTLAGPKSQELKEFADRLKKKAPQGDAATDEAFRLAYINAGMPFDGDQAHPIGKDSVTYHRVSFEMLEKNFGKHVAKEMGITWEREMLGHKIAIGSPLLNPDGTEMKKNFNDAKEACLALNGDKKAAVEKAFNDRENLLDQIGKDTNLDHGQKLERLTEIHKKNPVPGCYLMSREDWEVIEGDLGYQEKKYIPQILPRLKGRVFWSSSGFPYNAFSAFLFDGYSGFVGNGVRSYGSAVRCGCSAAGST